MNIMMLLEMAARERPDRVAIGPRNNSVSYCELYDLAGAAASRFSEADVETVVLCDESSAAVPVALFGAAWAGLPYVPLNYRLAPRDLSKLATRCGRAHAVVDPSNLALLDQYESINAEPTDKFMTAPPAGAPEPWPTNPDDVAVLLFTSGTTGAPKSAILRHRHLVSYILGTVEFMGAAEDEATLVSVPPYHVAGVASLLSSIYAGRRIVQLPKFDADDWIDTVEREAITHAMVVPTMLARIVDAIERRGGDPMLGVRALSYGGGKMPQSVVRRALDLFPITSFVNAYGLTETSSTIALLGPDDHRLAQYSEDPAEQQRLSSVGQPLPGIEIEIRDKQGITLASGQVGEIYVRGDQVAGEYREQGSLLDADSWFATRDGGHLNSDGYLFVQGRNDDVIIRGGENISPGEIEDVILGHPAVRDAAAVGVPCREWGERIIAVIVANPAQPSPDPDEIRTFVRDRLRSSRVPTHVEFVEELPYNETGKLLRRVLRASCTRLGDTDD